MLKYDILIKNGYIVDGTGNPSTVMDVGIADGKIRRMGRSLSGDAGEVIDVTGAVVCPGFIDLHNHTDLAALAYPRCESHIMQGITTSVVGNCGLAMAPINPEKLMLLQEYLAPFLPKGFDWGWNWRSAEEYWARIESQGSSMNMVPLASQGTIRLAVRGWDNGPSTPTQVEDMKRLLAENLEQGAWGMSTGLIYPPGCYADMAEIVELAKVVAKYGGVYTTHVRNEGDRLMNSVDEAINIGKASGVRVELSHHKAFGRNNWGKVNATLRVMEEARENGLDVTCDVYPYQAGSTTLTACMPPWTMTGGVSAMLKRLRDPELRKRIAREIDSNSVDMENMIGGCTWAGIVIASCPADHNYDGKSVETILKEAGRFSDPYGGFFDFILEIGGEASMVTFGMDEADLKVVLKHPLSSVITDAWLTNIEAEGKPHPRSYGSFPRVLSKYVREDKLLTLEEAVRKMTSMPASVVGLQDRGILREGLAADVVVFDPATIRDTATFRDPKRYPEGIHYVVVNGAIVVDHGHHTGCLSGKILRKGR